jgi:hypothetical protein
MKGACREGTRLSLDSDRRQKPGNLCRPGMQLLLGFLPERAQAKIRDGEIGFHMKGL